jgi:hypothetical protein
LNKFIQLLGGKIGIMKVYDITSVFPFPSEAREGKGIPILLKLYSFFNLVILFDSESYKIIGQNQPFNNFTNMINLFC